MSFISWYCVAVGFCSRVLCWWQMNNLLWVQGGYFQSQRDHYRERGCQWLITTWRIWWELQNGRNRWAGHGLRNGGYFSFGQPFNAGPSCGVSPAQKKRLILNVPFTQLSRGGKWPRYKAFPVASFRYTEDEDDSMIGKSQSLAAVHSVRHWSPLFFLLPLPPPPPHGGPSRGSFALSLATFNLGGSQKAHCIFFAPGNYRTNFSSLKWNALNPRASLRMHSPHPLL